MTNSQWERTSFTADGNFAGAEAAEDDALRDLFSAFDDVTVPPDLEASTIANILALAGPGAGALEAEASATQTAGVSHNAEAPHGASSTAAKSIRRVCPNTARAAAIAACLAVAVAGGAAYTITSAGVQVDEGGQSTEQIAEDAAQQAEGQSSAQQQADGQSSAKRQDENKSRSPQAQDSKSVADRQSAQTQQASLAQEQPGPTYWLPAYNSSQVQQRQQHGNGKTKNVQDGKQSQETKKDCETKQTPNEKNVREIKQTPGDDGKVVKQPDEQKQPGEIETQPDGNGQQQGLDPVIDKPQDESQAGGKDQDQPQHQEPNQNPGWGWVPGRDENPGEDQDDPQDQEHPQTDSQGKDQPQTPDQANNSDNPQIQARPAQK